MNLNDYIEKVLKPRRDVYLSYATDAGIYKLDISQTTWLSMADDIDTIIRELQDLVLNSSSKDKEPKYVRDANLF